MAIAKGTKRVAENRKARHEYFIEDTYECGIALVGTEVKSIRAGKVNLMALGLGAVVAYKALGRK